MRIAILIVIVISGFVSGFAQKAEKWQVLAHAKEEFTIEVPLALSYSDDKSDVPIELRYSVDLRSISSGIY
jgi:hemerythrin superfamily protein